MKIIGAGMAGLLAASMLRRHEPVIWEAQPSLPNNHNALLRFRSDTVARATGIPFRKVTVQKAICFKRQLVDRPTLQLGNMYSQKVTGAGLSRSILNLDTVERYIAPPDFIAQLSRGLNIEWGKSWVPQGDMSEPYISTIPMPTLLAALAWPGQRDNFPYRSISTISTVLRSPVDLYQTLYYPGEEPYYRASLTGNLLQIELLEPVSDFWKQGANQVVHNVLYDFGIHSDYEKPEISYQKYGKISPIDSNLRNQFILWASDNFSIYSLGRFATWRQLLLDDIVRDVQIIDSFITRRDAYSHKLSTI